MNAFIDCCLFAAVQNDWKKRKRICFFVNVVRVIDTKSIPEKYKEAHSSEEHASLQLRYYTSL